MLEMFTALKEKPVISVTLGHSMLRVPTDGSTLLAMAMELLNEGWFSSTVKTGSVEVETQEMFETRPEVTLEGVFQVNPKTMGRAEAAKMKDLENIFRVVS